MRKLIVILAFLILGFAVSLFLKVSRIEVSGANRIDINAIVSAGGLATGESVIFADTNGAEKRILAEFPYIESVHIYRKLPTTLRIDLIESTPIAYIELQDGNYAKISESGRVLELIDAEQDGRPGGIRITGVGAGLAKPGAPYEPGDDETIRFGYCLEFLQAVNNSNETRYLLQYISYINASDLLDFKFDLNYNRGFIVSLGSREQTTRKLGTLTQTLEKLNPTDSGTLDLSVIGEAHLIPS
ncbi:MAG: FtsQ-type POTRA domain-containing protein [Oscillospiraceae bacterium]|jgi:hypothetical protein|nr:FtsQ-type POTRA domain-containing protein [Oscillospiraceae bacterium]